MSHRLRRRRPLSLACAIGLVLAASSALAAEVEYLITFNRVLVEGRPPTGGTPAEAHQSSPSEAAPLEPSDDGDTSAPAPSVIELSPRTGLPFTPGQTPPANPSFVEHDFRVEAFWAVRTGTPEGYYKRAHFHPADLSSGFEAQHLGNPSELHGLFIRSLDGQPFGVKSVRYRVTRNRQIPAKPVSVLGYTNFSVQLLLSQTFDPRRPVRAQFVGVPLGPPLGNDPSLPWIGTHVFGFEYVEQLFIASSASVDIDDIVLVRHEAAPRAPARPAGRPATPGATDDRTKEEADQPGDTDERGENPIESR